jgi:hypothetical protein
VDDVHGSFLIGNDGSLLARDLPTVFRDQLFADVGPRLVRLRETLESEGEDVKSIVLLFTEHKLHVRPVGASLLCIITGARVNGPALRMATNLVTKHVEMEAITPKPGHTHLSGAPRDSVAPSAPDIGSGQPKEPMSMAKREVMYRGRRPA